MAKPWRPNFRVNYWLSLVLAAVGGATAIYGVVTGMYIWFGAGSALALISLLTTRLRGPGSVPIPGMKNPLKGDFAPIGDPPPEGERVTVVEVPEDAEQHEEPAPPQE